MLTGSSLTLAPQQSDNSDVTRSGVNGAGKQQAYPVFNISLRGPEVAKFQGEEEKFGINTYAFRSEVPPTKVGTLDLPTASIPVEDEETAGNTTLDEMY